MLQYFTLVIERPYYKSHIQQALSRSPIAMLIGPRQCGKTTLAHRFAPVASENYSTAWCPLKIQL